MAKLTINEAAAGFTHKQAFDYTDLQSSTFLSNLGAANQKAIGKLPPGDIIDLAEVFVVTAATGVTDATLDFGTQTNDPDELIDAVAIGNTAINGSFINGGDTWSTAGTAVGQNNTTTATKTLYMEVNGTHTALTAGAWVLAWRQLTMPKA